jgi:putative addiction module killer protein
MKATPSRSPYIALEQGNFFNVEGVGGGVYECKVNFGPGYRVHFGKDGEQVVMLLGGSGKKRQGAAIAAAQASWADYKRAKSRDTGIERNTRKQWR